MSPLLTLALLLALATPAVAQAVTQFSWTPGVVDATHQAATSYTVKCGTTAGGPYSVTRTIAGTPLATTLAINQVVTAAGRYFCVVTATNAGGESGPSNEVTFSFAPPNAPANLQAN